MSKRRTVVEKNEGKVLQNVKVSLLSDVGDSWDSLGCLAVLSPAVLACSSCSTFPANDGTRKVGSCARAAEGSGRSGGLRKLLAHLRTSMRGVLCRLQGRGRGKRRKVEGSCWGKRVSCR